MHANSSLGALTYYCSAIVPLGMRSSHIQARSLFPHKHNHQHAAEAFRDQSHSARIAVMGGTTTSLGPVGALGDAHHSACGREVTLL